MLRFLFQIDQVLTTSLKHSGSLGQMKPLFQMKSYEESKEFLPKKKSTVLTIFSLQWFEQPLRLIDSFQDHGLMVTRGSNLESRIRLKNTGLVFNRWVSTQTLLPLLYMTMDKLLNLSYIHFSCLQTNTQNNKTKQKTVLISLGGFQDEEIMHPSPHHSAWHCEYSNINCD